MGKGNYVRGIDKLVMLGYDPMQISRRQRAIAEMRARGYTLEEIGRIYGVSRQRIWQLVRTHPRQEEEIQQWKAQYIEAGHYDI